MRKSMVLPDVLMFMFLPKLRQISVAIACIVTITLGGCVKQTEPEVSEDRDLGNISKLELVQERQQLICGVNGQLPGFSFADAQGVYSGMDVDFCRAVAAALFDDPEAVIFRDLNTQERLEVVQK